MLRIILVRHGETESNQAGVYCGWHNSQLTEKGLRQAYTVSEKLKQEKIDHIISSDLDRTLKTAEIINDYHHVQITVEKNFREMHFGLWEGLNYKEISQNYKMALKDWEKDWIDFKVPEGESLRQMYERVTKGVDKIIEMHKEGNFLVVSHSGCIRAMVAYLIGRGIEDYWKYKIDNCGITTIEILDGFFILTGMNQ
ncbi:alpha-ribazole phosphatase [Clostridiaceae bacterium 35-E11]